MRALRPIRHAIDVYSGDAGLAAIDVYSADAGLAAIDVYSGDAGHAANMAEGQNVLSVA